MRKLRGGFNYTGGAQRSLFVSKSVTPPEHIEQVRLCTWIEATKRLQTDEAMKETLHWIHSIPNGAHVHPATARKLIAEGLKSGILDLSCDEARQGFHGLRVEMKRRGNKPTPNQLRYMKYLEHINIRREVCYTWQAAARVFIDYLSLTIHAPVYE